MTSVYVTHDQVEAMTLADRIVVMNDRIIEQVGTLMDLFMNPVNTFVAGFLGSPPMNQIHAKMTANSVEAKGQAIGFNGVADGAAGRDVIVGIRPEHITLKPSKNSSPLSISLDLVEPLGS